MEKILLVEDERGLNEGIKYELEKEGYKVLSAFSIKEATQFLLNDTINMAILDVNLPDGEGFELCKLIKKKNDISILFLTARDLEGDTLYGYDLGAEDYITKPFSMMVLKKKIEVILRRKNTNFTKEEFYKDNYLEINVTRGKAICNNKELFLTPTEYKLIRLFIQNPNRILTHKIMLEKVWEQDGQYIDKHTVAVNINRLRAKIEDTDHRYIATIYGMGYQWLGENNE